MQHLTKDHGIKKPFVNLVAPEELDPPKTIEDFYKFPARKGWCVDQKDYRLRVLPIIAAASQNGTSKKDLPLIGVKLKSFLQAWLFFGLIFTVVQGENGSLMKYSELVDRGYITTETLRSKLDEWVAWESTRPPPPGQRLRMIRLEAVLQFARRVVRANLACSDAATPPRGYSTQASDASLYVPDSIILSIMVLGETLHGVKSRIAQTTGTEMRGWQNEDDSGWGPPRFVLKEMKDKNLCPRTVRLLRGQLRSNATLLLAALQSTKKLASNSKAHIKCLSSTCLVTPEAEGGDYSQTHCETFCSNQYSLEDTCSKSSKDASKDLSETYIEKIVDIISRDETKRPLLQFKDIHDESTTTPELEVVEWHPSMEYATISHVWSDGFGNPKENKMLDCQLKLIRNLLGKLELKPDFKPDSTTPSIPFWIDTLMIPVGGDEKRDVRRKSIRQIPKIFKGASHTIVLDWGLHGIDPDVQKPAQTAMRIIASGWMRRLWTLQEAFLSKSLQISQGKDAENLHFLDDLYKQLDEKTDGHASTLITTVKNQLQSHVMHEQRTPSSRQAASVPETGEAIEGVQWSPRKAAVLVVNAWKAVRWRATANELHETLALASLLDLEFKDTLIEAAGLTKPGKINTEDTAAKESRNKEKDEAMKQFWKSFNNKWPASIPPGIIFLPGERVQIPGFGWAPRTWLSAHEVDDPDPLSVINSTAELHEPLTQAPEIAATRGLRVCFPGFLLFAERRNILFTPNAESRVFRFPVDKNLQEWYKVEATDDKISTAFLENGTSEEKPLAIILSRSRPQEFPSEIGLLVQIYNRADETTYMQTVHRDRERGSQSTVEIPIDEYRESAFHCEILHRVKVSRDTKVSRGYSYRTNGPMEGDANASVVEGSDEAESYRVPDILLPSESDEEICIGETLRPNQIWYVDGLIAEWPKATPVEQEPIRSEAEDPIDLPKRNDRIRRIRVLQSQNATESGPKQVEESQSEFVPGPARRGHTAGTHPEAMLALEPLTHQPQRRLKKMGTWATTRFKKGLGSR